jgi:hypothetical protein
LSRESCVDKVPGDRLVLIREWAIEACRGNLCAAALLAFFEHIHNTRLENRRESAGRNAIARRQGQAATQDEDLWQHWNEQELRERLLNLYAEKAIRRALPILYALKFVKLGGNPDPTRKGDRTNWFLFQPDKVNKWIERYKKRKAGKATGGGSGAAPKTAYQKDSAKRPDGAAKRPYHDSAKRPEGSGQKAVSSMHDGEHDPNSMREEPASPDSPPTDEQLKSRIICMYFEHLGHRNYQPTYGQCALMIERVKNETAWKEALEIWRTNRYSAQNITGLLSRYEKLVEHYAAQEESARPAPRFISAPAEIKEKASAAVRVEIEQAARLKMQIRAEESGEPYQLEELMSELQLLFCATYQFLQPIVEPLLASNE